MNLGQEKMKKYRFILDSFTNKELNFNPQEIIKSRIKRISNGSGTKEEDVKELLTHVKKMKKMFKQFGARGGSSQGLMKKMLGGKMPDMSKFNDMDPKQLEEMSKNFKSK
jgi:signal recognition particle subunit SRP54